MLSEATQQVMMMASAILSPKSGKQSEIECLTAQVNHLTAAFDVWNRWMIWGLGVAALAAVWIVLTTRMTLVLSKQLTVAQDRLATAKEAQLKLDLREKDERIADADKVAGEANERAALAQLELARLNGPPYLITVEKGIAKPDLSQSNKQVVLLTKDNTVVELPTLPKGKHFDWTLSLIQNEVGGHRFKFSPDIGQFNSNVDVSPRTGWLVHFQTDETGTKSVGWGGVRIDAPKNQ